MSNLRQKIVGEKYDRINVVVHISIPIENKKCWVRDKVLKDCWGCP
jgi:hypothetical protein